MKNKELINYIIEKFNGVLVDDYDIYHYTIDGKPYDIRFDPNRVEWSCDCKAFTFRHRWGRKFCKHINEIQNKKFSHRQRGRVGARVV